MWEVNVNTIDILVSFCCISEAKAIEYKKIVFRVHLHILVFIFILLCLTIIKLINLRTEHFKNNNKIKKNNLSINKFINQCNIILIFYEYYDISS